jgi:hypothetical protein
MGITNFFFVTLTFSQMAAYRSSPINTGKINLQSIIGPDREYNQN